MTTYVITASYLHGHTEKKYIVCDRTSAAFAIYKSFLHAGIELTKENFGKILYALEDTDIDSINLKLSDYTEMNCNNIDYITCNIANNDIIIHYAILSDINYQSIIFDKMDNAVAAIYNHFKPYTDVDDDILHECIYSCLKEAKYHYQKYIVLRIERYIGMAVVCEFLPRYWDDDISVKITFYREYEFCNTYTLNDMINFIRKYVKYGYVTTIDDMKRAFTNDKECKYSYPNQAVCYDYNLIGLINDGKKVKVYKIPSEIEDIPCSTITN